ncbi:ABC transporter permease [Chitinophaga sp. Ak27]|uniref:ABC transporter permease n=1 Tax=Chitinophaga sp. Ak27 TaxID=2726116 RepID=UPI00145E35E0|nr:ABC transporter permease [Chitinophaga sp. Ak27]NLU95475.1 FtsX-like permease family protein [Chitinophaga sp. Ak27]
MYSNYLQVAWRNLKRNKGFAFINILGLAIGMAIVMLIGLWIRDELTWNKSLKNYHRITQVIHNWDNTAYHTITTTYSMPIPLVEELRSKYGGDFSHIALYKPSVSRILAYGDKKLSQDGWFAEPEMMDILAPTMIAGPLHGLTEPNSIMLSKTLARSFFGDTDPINKMINVDNKKNVKVTGVFEDFPANSHLQDVHYLVSWAYLVADRSWVKEAYDQWNNNSFFILAQLADKADLNKVSATVKDALKGKPGRRDNPEVLLHPMSKWHLYDAFTNGKNTGGNIRYVWIFGAIGIFVLILACINFMNLNTARSQKRAREIGVRKAIGSGRLQLMRQFLGEALLVAALSLLLAVLLVQLALPFFNTLANKTIHIPWQMPAFWGSILGLTLLTGLLAGSYPAFYLSSLNTLRVLKGTFKAGRAAALPRKVLVVVQFTVSVALIIGTTVIYLQIQHAKNRPLGFDRNGLINVSMVTPELYGKYNTLRQDLLASGAAVDMAAASNPSTDIFAHFIGFKWPGQDPSINPAFAVSWVSHDFGKTVNWQFAAGRDFSREYATDSTGMILNESAVAFMGLKDPVGATIKFNDNNFHVVGVIKNVVMESPFATPVPTIFMMDYGNVSEITIRLNPAMGAPDALDKIAAIFRKYSPAAPFNYTFADDDYARKFSAEDRISKLSAFFAVFAVFISCLGIFGLASFMAEQRTKEIGIRKVLGASVMSLWGLLSREFLLLPMLSFCVAMPAAGYVMHHWLEGYEYRIDLSVWIFTGTAFATLFITLSTVSFQAIKAALSNPVNSLRAE